MRPNIVEHDFDTKARAAEKFLKAGDKVKVTIMFRGREVTHADLGRQLCEKLTERVADFASVERAPKLEGRHIIMILVPKN